MIFQGINLKSKEEFITVPFLPEIKAAAIVSKDGLPITSLLHRGASEKEVGALTATLFSLSKKLIMEMQRGGFDQLYILGSDGNLLLLNCGLEAVLIVSTDKYGRLGLILLDCRRLCEQISAILDGEE